MPKRRTTTRRKRITRLEKKIIDLWETLGTIEFNTFSDIAMMLDETDVGKVRKIIHKLIDEDKLFLIYKDCWYLDYIPF